MNRFWSKESSQTDNQTVQNYGELIKPSHHPYTNKIIWLSRQRNVSLIETRLPSSRMRFQVQVDEASAEEI